MLRTSTDVTSEFIEMMVSCLDSRCVFSFAHFTNVMPTKDYFHFHSDTQIVEHMIYFLRCDLATDSTLKLTQTLSTLLNTFQVESKRKTETPEKQFVANLIRSGHDLYKNYVALQFLSFFLSRIYDEPIADTFPFKSSNCIICSCTAKEIKILAFMRYQTMYHYHTNS